MFYKCQVEFGDSEVPLLANMNELLSKSRRIKKMYVDV